MKHISAHSSHCFASHSSHCFASHSSHCFASHSFTLLCITFFTLLCITSQAQNTSPVNVIEFRKIPNGIMDEGKLDRNQLEDYDSNPVCLIKVKAQGFDETVMQKFVFVPRNIMIMKTAFENNEWRIYVSSKKLGSLTIKYQGDCKFDLPYMLEPKKIYELVLGMETATLNIISTPDNATIYVDNEKVGVGFASKSVSIGAEHKYKVECEDYITEENTITFTQSEKKEIEVELRPNFGFITVKTTPSGADVYVDDKLVGKTPYLSEIISRGMHKITVNKQGYETAVKRLNINLNEEQTVEFTLVEGESSMPVQQVVVEPVKQETAAKENVPEPKEIKNVTSETLPNGNIVYRLDDITFEMVKVEGGTFLMGAQKKKKEEANYDKEAHKDEKPVHSVTLSDYYIGKFEVTQELWQAVMGSNPSYYKGNKNPVEQVSWNDCQEFIRKLNQLTGQNFRLPTEAEWEYAARGGNKSKGYKYSGSNSINDVAWYWENSGDRFLSGDWNYDRIKNNNCKTHAVGTKSSNELGIYDMSGNVWEWCQDWYGSYGSGSQTNPTGASSGSFRVLRGGSWYFNSGRCRVSLRGINSPDFRDNFNGLRLVQ